MSVYPFFTCASFLIHPQFIEKQDPSAKVAVTTALSSHYNHQLTHNQTNEWTLTIKGGLEEVMLPSATQKLAGKRQNWSKVC